MDYAAEGGRTFLPAMGRDWLLPLYDPFTKLIGAESILRQLIDQAELRPSDRVLDVGCGTGRLVLMIKQRVPDAHVTGLDPDPKALDRAQRKAMAAGCAVRFDRGFGDRLPYGAETFDRVFSSFMLHHLQGDEKTRTLGEIRRVLKPGGRLELVDFGGPEFQKEGLLARLVHSHQFVKDQSRDRMLAMMGDAGLSAPRCVAVRPFVFGRVAFYQAVRQS